MKFDFPSSTKIAPGGFDLYRPRHSRFRTVRGGGFSSIGNLRTDQAWRRKLELVDDKNQIVESFTFSDDAPCLSGRTVTFSTLERICPTGPVTDPYNWASSKRASREGREGTQAAQRYFLTAPSSYGGRGKVGEIAAPSAISRYQQRSAARDPLRSLSRFPHASAGSRSARQTNWKMKRVSGNAMGGSYQATIPAQSKDTLVRFFITVSNGDGAERIYPSKNELTCVGVTFSALPRSVAFRRDDH